MADLLSALEHLASGVWHWLQGHPKIWIQNHPWMSTCTAFVLALSQKVWTKLEPKAVDFISQSLEHRIAVVITGYRKLYAKYLYYKNRTFDVKGFSRQGKFALELETVYVNLDVDPTALGTVSRNLLRLSKDAQRSDDRGIFTWLKASPQHSRNFAIIGPPGSGKTTLLKHLALLLSARKAPIRATPILLSFRDHASKIATNPEIALTDLVESSLKDLPPPSGWFKRRLQRGKCLIMFDGLDEVADPTVRVKVVRWVERQVEFLGENRFLISSRPNGYRDNPLAGFTALEVLPFKPAQVEQFIRNWYLANELVAHQKNDPGVRMEAREGADELLDRLRRSPALQDLAVNPLLLTLIATVHRYHGRLPGRRVELFAEICDVFLGKRQQAKGIELDLNSAQKIRVLRVLAFEMMCREVREVTVSEALALIEPTLKLVAPDMQSETFLSMIEDSSALLIQMESGVYGFAHLTFQEYLASFHIKEERLVTQIANHVDETWWHETARLYAAQSDASPILEKCLAYDRPPLEALLLAADCEREALELEEYLRDRLKNITSGMVEDPDPYRRRHAAEYLLERRLRDMMQVSENRYIDSSPVTNAEYQLFVEEMQALGEYRQPDHWRHNHFALGLGIYPVVGLRKGDAEEFCSWLTARRSGLWSYSLPLNKELLTFCQVGVWQDIGFMCKENEEDIPILPWNQICKQLKEDLDVKTAFGNDRQNWFVFCTIVDLDRRNILDLNPGPEAIRTIDPSTVNPDVARVLERHLKRASIFAKLRARARILYRTFEGSQSSYTAIDRMVERSRLLDRARIIDLALSLARSLRGALERSLDRNLDYARTTGPNLDDARARVRNLALPRIIEPDLDLAHTFGCALDLDIDHDLKRALERNLDRNIDRNLDRNLNRASDLVSELESNLTRNLESDLALSTFVLNWLCVVEKRTRSELPATDGLWIARERKSMESNA